MLPFEYTHNSVQHYIRCYQELRKDMLSVSCQSSQQHTLAQARHSLFSSRRNYRTEELSLGLPQFDGYRFGIN